MDGPPKGGSSQPSRIIGLNSNSNDNIVVDKRYDYCFATSIRGGNRYCYGYD